ncbi:MAG: Trk family potassium uptake protein [Clostridiales bacterium]|nr:Trk family potassium uptake protein [Clostridiales bacterium]
MTAEQRQYKFKRKRRIRPNSAHIIVLGFLGVILLGAFLLCLPISAKSRHWMNFLDAIFTATSAVSTTGLTVTGDTSLYFSAFGQGVLLVLIQFGGVGFMCITTLFMLLLRRKITIRDRMLMRAEFNQNENRGMVRLGRNIMLVTLGIEGVGFLLLLYPFVARNGAIGVWQALFTSVSAFCNAGFDVMGVTQGAGTSLMGFASNVTVNLSVSFLILLGGLGFTVLMDLGNSKGNFRKLSFHSKITLVTSFSLILLGWVFYFGAEYNNAGTLGNMTAGDKLLASLFQSISPRSTGFATIEQSEMHSASKFMTMILMFIGASPGSTGGGIRTTTFAVLILVMIAGIRGNDDVTVRRRKIDPHTTRKAAGVFISSLAVVIIATFILLFTEKGHADPSTLTFENVLFETFSAYTTAGLSCGIVSTLSAPGKIVLSLLMFFGRVGMVTIGLMFLRKRGIDDRIGYPEANIMIG